MNKGVTIHTKYLGITELVFSLSFNEAGDLVNAAKRGNNNNHNAPDPTLLWSSEL